MTTLRQAHVIEQRVRLHSLLMAGYIETGKFTRDEAAEIAFEDVAGLSPVQIKRRARLETRILKETASTR